MPATATPKARRSSVEQQFWQRRSALTEQQGAGDDTIVPAGSFSSRQIARLSTPFRVDEIDVRAMLIDLHCHLLPNIDDGPRHMADAIAMARMAVANGIKRAVVTPHIHPNRFDNDQQDIAVAFDRYRRILEREHIGLELGMAAEVHLSPESLKMVECGRIPFLGELDGYRLLLLELPHSHIPVGTEKAVQWCLARGIRPIIAHPERNKDVIRDLSRIEPLIDLGCLLQVTAGALLGTFGRQAKKRAEQLLKRSSVFLLASDAHNTSVRVPDLEGGRAAAAAIVGEAESWCLVCDNPERLWCARGPVSAARVARSA